MPEQHSTELRTALSAVESHERALRDCVVLAASLTLAAVSSAPSVLQTRTEELRTMSARVQSTRQALQSAVSQLGPDDRAIYSERARVPEGRIAYYELFSDRLARSIHAILPSSASAGVSTTGSSDSKPEPST